MKTFLVRDAKTRFEYMIDTARQEQVSVEKHGRPVVVVFSVKDYERLVDISLHEDEERRSEAR
ncbi:MAG: type II toxin-antitoxin system prevent-host-death family antitoxin [Rhodobacteraceae bacterium]|nr:type II toxin-antitoxin system prevent-host-death family antitoxin [Paracoccaceae bacterium]